MPPRPTVSIIDVSPRDGLQNEDALVSTADKVLLIELLIAAGVQSIEAASFVHPELVPQMADAEELMKRVPRPSGVRYIGLALNERGAIRALEADVDEVNMVVAASDAFSMANQGVDAFGGVARALRVAELVADAGRPLSVTVSTAFGCPFEGEVPVARLTELVGAAAAANPVRINIADTIGVAAPTDVAERIAAVARVTPEGVDLAVHFHNTRNTGYANAVAAYEAGVRTFDASAGGVGGCPFAPKATGNIATEDLVYLLHRMGVETGIHLARLVEASTFLEGPLAKQVPALLPKAGPFPDGSVSGTSV